MTRFVSMAIIAVALAPAALGLVNACSDWQGADPATRNAQMRFQANFCSKQYRSQSDVARCLAHGV